MNQKQRKLKIRLQSKRYKKDNEVVKNNFENKKLVKKDDNVEFSKNSIIPILGREKIKEKLKILIMKMKQFIISIKMN